MSKIITDKSKYKEYDDRLDKILNDTAIKNGMTKKPDAIAYIEKHYPETTKEFQRIQFEQWHTFCKKQMDYGPSNISMGTGVGKSVDAQLATTALIVRINDKVQRLLNLVVKHNRDAQNEPVEDAFKDLSVYGIIAQIVKNGKWGI